MIDNAEQNDSHIIIGEWRLNRNLLRKVKEIPLVGRAKIFTRSSDDLQYIGDVTNKLPRELKSITHLGDKAIQDMNASLAPFNLAVGQQIPGWPEKYIYHQSYRDYRSTRESNPLYGALSRLATADDDILSQIGSQLKFNDPGWASKDAPLTAVLTEIVEIQQVEKHIREQIEIERKQTTWAEQEKCALMIIEKEEAVGRILKEAEQVVIQARRAVELATRWPEVKPERRELAESLDCEIKGLVSAAGVELSRRGPIPTRLRNNLRMVVTDAANFAKLKS